MRLQRGFTMIELMITIMVLGLVLGLGVPGFRDLVLNNRQASAVNELVTALQLARSEAITRNVAAPSAVSVCASNDGAACAGTWSDGWIVFNDADGDGALDAGEIVLRAVDAPASMAITGPGGAMRYRRDGRSPDATDFVFCDSRGASRARVVQLGLTGRPAAAKVLSDGSAPACG